jgi:hypothetical protein
MSRLPGQRALVHDRNPLITDPGYPRITDQDRFRPRWMIYAERPLPYQLWPLMVHDMNQLISVLVRVSLVGLMNAGVAVTSAV